MTDKEKADAQLIREYILNNLIPWAYEKGISPNTIAITLHCIGKMVTMSMDQINSFNNDGLCKNERIN